MSLDQVKDTYPCLTGFIMTEHRLVQPKCCLATLPLSAKLQRCINHHNASANKPSLTGVGMSLVQIKYTYPCLPAFTMTEHWLAQPKMLPCHIAVECQKSKMHQPSQNFCK